MGNILILYKSKYGATKKYVELLQAQLGCNAWDIDAYRGPGPETHDWVIFAGGIYASGIAGLNTLRKKFRGLDHKRTVIFCVGASPFDETAFAALKARNLKEDLKDIPMFYGRGAWDERSMTWKDRTLCRLLEKAVSKSDPSACEPWMRALLSAVGQSCDWTDPSYLTPLLDYLRSGSQL